MKNTNEAMEAMEVESQAFENALNTLSNEAGVTRSPIWQRLQDRTREVYEAWFNSMTKKELLTFLAECEEFDADCIRDMIKRRGPVMCTGTEYDMLRNTASVKLIVDGPADNQ